MNNISKNIEAFETNGFTIFNNFLLEEDVENLKFMLVNGYNTTLNKNINENNISEYISKFEEEERFDELYHSFKQIRLSDSFISIGDRLNTFYQDNFHKKSKLINTGYAIGIKDSKRTAYDWHQEKPYYKDTNTIHFQFPILYPCIKDNGTMSVLEGSQKLGYIEDVVNEKINDKSINTFVPRKIESLKKTYTEKYLNMSLRDVGLFDQNVIHKSNRNITNKVRFAGIVRLEIIH